MATAAEIQVELNNTAANGARILRSDQSGGTTGQYYVVGGVTYGGRARWCDATLADNAATQAASIATAMAA